jgi:hypothetical protein
LLDHLLSRTLADTDYEDIFAEFCDKLVSAGLPLLRAHLTLNTL